MTPTTKKYAKFEDLKQVITMGIIFAAGIGLLWAVLYWRNDIKFAIGVIFIHVLCGSILSLFIIGLANILRIKMNLTALLVSFLGFFWVCPVLLFNIDTHYINLDVSTKGFLITSIAASGISLLGFLVGYFLSHFSSVLRLVFAIALGLIVPLCFALIFPEKSRSNITGSDITIVNRLYGKLTKSKPQTRVMVLGIDGGTWDVIIPLLKQGKLPNLRALMEDGQYGILYSDAGSTWSPVVWTSIFTGKLPEKHGITEWEISDSRNRFSKSLWNIVNDYGQKALTVNIPGTFPPEKILGVQISGFPIPGDIQKQGYGRLYSTESRNLEILPTTKISTKPAEGWSSTPISYSPLYESHFPPFALVENRLGKLRYGSYNVNLSNLFIEFIDKRGNFLTKGQQEQYAVLIADTTDDGTVNYNALYIYTKKNDSEPVVVLNEGQWSGWIGLTINGAETKFRFKLLSLSKDHLEIYATPFFQSSFSPKIPFAYPQDYSSELSKGIGQYVVEGVGWVLYKDEIALDLLYEHLEDVANQHFRASEYLLKTIPDWALFVHIFTESDRVQHPYWRYYQPQYYQNVDKNLVRKHGQKINSTMEKIDAQIGKLLSYLDGNTTVVVVSDHGFQANATKSEAGDHSPEGIYILGGKGVINHQGALFLDTKSFPKASILDVTPTILYLMGYPVGKDMDGKVMLDIIDDKKLKCCQVKFIDSYESDLVEKGRARQMIDESTKDQLKSLGYMK